MSWIDWTIVAVFVVGINLVGLYCRRYMKSVSDWLVASRGVGRYLGMLANSVIATGVISIVNMLQAAYVGGAAYFWFHVQYTGIGLILAISGWGVYRLRETRVMTVNELLEKRYSRRFRIFCGFISFLAGITYMGIFPIVGGRFFTYFCGLPQQLDILGAQIPTVPVITAIILFISVLFCLFAGQISIVITDFIQMAVIMLMYIAVGFAVYRVVTPDQVAQAILAQPNTAEILNPFNFTEGNEFNMWFIIMVTFQWFYGVLSWAPHITRGQSAKDPKEARFMLLVNYLKFGSGIALFFFAPLACFAFMKLPVFAEQAENVRNVLAGLGSEKIQTQMAVPLFLAHIFPVGLMGLFVAAMLFAFISTHDSYLLSWAGVFIQDVVMPIRKRPLEQRQHLWLLKIAVIGIAIFIYLFGMFFRQTQYLIMHLALVAAIFTAGAGAVILGALYWKRATVAGAWAAMIAGALLAVIGLVLTQVWDDFPLNGLQVSFIANITSLVIYVLVSLLTKDMKFDLHAILHRKGGVNEEVLARRPSSDNWFVKHLDGILWTVAILILVVTAFIIWYNLTHEVPVESWLRFWKYYAFISFFISIPATLWVIFGGSCDVYRLIKFLSTKKIDITDDGFVRHS
ncbi:MAG: sodium:solute symporter family protein [Planctomycetota bacterium]